MKNVFFMTVFLAVFSCLSLAMLAPPQTARQYVSRKLKRLVEELPLTNIPQEDTVILVPSVISNKTIVFDYNERNELCHVGLSLFSPEIKNMLDSHICNFLERFILELLLEKDKEGIEFKLTENHVQLFIDGQSHAKKNLWSLQELMKTMDMPVNFSLRHKDGRATAVWLFDTHSLQLDFPLYRELIEGTDKKESDDNLYNRLNGMSFMKIDMEDDKLDSDSLNRFRGDIYVERGEQFGIKELSSDRYFLKESEGFVPLFHKKYPTYSLNNLFFIKSLTKDVNLLLTHRQYGRFTPEISIPLINFLEFFKEDFILTSHTGIVKNDKLETILVLNHKTLGYIHILRVQTQTDDLFLDNLTLKGDFYSNIPQHYIKTLLK